MYLPGHFAIEDASVTMDVVDERRAGTLVVSSAGGFEASLLPWLLVRSAEPPVLRGHVAKANPLAKLAGGGQPALVVFDAVDGYVSPSWYPSKQADGRVVPTWNYVSVHVHGTVRAVDDPAWLRTLVEALTDRQERELEQPWSVRDAPDDYLAKMLRGIVGLEVLVDRFEGKAKLSQNRPVEDQAGVRQALAGWPQSAPLLAAMEAIAREP
jgi:transcriptional regulator